MFRSTILLLYTTTVEVDVCCGIRVKKNLRKGELVCVWGAVGKEEGLVAYLTPTTRPSRRTKSKQKDCRPFFFLYAKRVFHRWLPLSSSAVTLEIPFHFGFPLIFLFLFFCTPSSFFFPVRFHSVELIILRLPSTQLLLTCLNEYRMLGEWVHESLRYIFFQKRDLVRIFLMIPHFYFSFLEIDLLERI